MRKLTAKDVTFTLECEPEDIQIEGNCSAIDPVTDRETAEWIRKELDSGNEWAWCKVCVIASWKEWEGRDYLGACSYSSRESFMEPGGYYDDMKHEALAELNAEVARAAACLEAD